MLKLEHFQLVTQTPDAWLWFLLAAPLAGALVNGVLTLFSTRGFISVNQRVYGVIACLASFLSFFTSWSIFLRFRELPEGTVLSQDLFSWVESAAFQVKAGLQLDALSMAMVLFITFVASFIHLYSIGYMKDDPGIGRYFTYMNLFLFSMLALILADNFLLLFLGWEGVGFCSYLLISFWFEDEAKADAGKKAIIVNRIGDSGFMVGVLIVFAATGTLNFNEVMGQKQVFGEALATAACLCFFLGAVGKSAQIPLYVWL